MRRRREHAEKTINAEIAKIAEKKKKRTLSSRRDQIDAAQRRARKARRDDLSALDKNNDKLIIAELEKRTGIKVESVGENK